MNCNFACDYCYEDKKMHSLSVNEGGFMSDEVCDNIIKLCEERIQKKSSFSVTWYGGEPMLAKNIIEKLTKEFIRICDDKKTAYHAGMITNGYLLSKENIYFLIDNKVTFIQVTVDGSREVHDKRRPLKSGGGTFDRIMENISLITEDMPITVAIRMNIDKRNQLRVTELLINLQNQGFNRLKNKSIYFGQTIHYANSCPDIESQCMVTREFSDFMVDAFSSAIDMNFKLSFYPNVPFGSCGAVGTNSAVIEPNGNVHNCWNTVGNESQKTGFLSNGAIQYNTNHIKWLGWTTFNDECNNCNVLPLCMGNCAHRYIYNIEIANVQDNSCKWWKYNLGPMLQITKKATNNNLFVHERG